MSALLVTCFAFSGATSLLLQVIWVRKLLGIFGASSLAIATVLATFMAGLAIGSSVGGRLSDRLQERREWTRDPLFYYGLAEIVVGLCALAILPLIDVYRGTNAWLWQQLGDLPWLLALARFFLTGTVLLLPTTAMGATLPLLTRKVTRSREDMGRLGSRLGILYAVNTLGALAGAASAGFWFIPELGLQNSNVAAASAALGIGGLVLLLSFRRARSPAESNPLQSDEESWGAEVEGTSSREEPSISLQGTQRKWVLATYALSGAVAMALEVLWSRTLAIVNGSSTYSFTLVLCTFLLGISLGSAAASKLWGKTGRPFVVLFGLFAVASLGILLFHRLADELPQIFLILMEGTALEVETVLGGHAFLTAIIILPTALSLGAIMPVAIRAYVGGVEEVGRDVGRAYAANTVGAIAGSLLGGFVLLPTLGLETGAKLCALLMAAASAVLLSKTTGRRYLYLLPVTSLLLALIAPSWNRSDFTAGLFRTHQASRYIERGGLFDRQVVYYRDGVSTTVSVEKFGGGWVLRNNGKVEASDRHDMPTQILVGLLPLLAHGGDNQEVFLVGYGSGVTVGSIGLAPFVSEVDVVELEPAVYEAADRYFGGFNNRPNENPKVRRLLGDGRNVLLAGGKKYDVIISEPSNPWIAGVASLFTREFYSLAKEHLEEDGVFCQWAQLYELGPRNVKMIYRTFAESFDYVYAFTPGDETTDTILLGSDRPLDFGIEALEKKLHSSEEFRQELLRAEIALPEDLLASLLLAPSEVGAFTAGGTINTDDNSLLEYSAPHDLLASAHTGHFARRVRGSDWPYGDVTHLLNEQDQLSGLRHSQLARALMTYGRLRRANEALVRAEEKGHRSLRLRLVLKLAEARDYLDPELAITEGGPPLPNPSPDLFVSGTGESAESLREVYRLYAQGRWDAAWQQARRLPLRTKSSDGRDVTLLMAYLAYKSLEMDTARSLLEPLAKDANFRHRRPAVFYYLGRSHFGLGHFRDAIDILEDFAGAWPSLASEVVATKL